MSKIKVSADSFLTIMKSIMNDEEINPAIEDVSAPQEWIGKTVQDALNVEYYTFKHRPMDTALVIEDLLRQGKSPSSLYALTRAFCILSLENTERVFSKDNDVVTVSANLEYWIQTEKVKLLEDMFEDIAVETCGIRIPVQIGEEKRHAVIALGNLNVSEVQEVTEFGEMAVCDIDVDIVFHPESTSKADYEVSFLVNEQWVPLHFSSLALSSNMTQKSVPYANNVRNVGNINLSKVKSFVLSFDGYKNTFIDELFNSSFDADIAEELPETDNNTPIFMRVKRKDATATFLCVVKEHTIQVHDDVGNETHSLTLTTRGVKDGTT